MSAEGAAVLHVNVSEILILFLLVFYCLHVNMETGPLYFYSFNPVGMDWGESAQKVLHIISSKPFMIERSEDGDVSVSETLPCCSMPPRKRPIEK